MIGLGGIVPFTRQNSQFHSLTLVAILTYLKILQLDQVIQEHDTA